MSKNISGYPIPAYNPSKSYESPQEVRSGRLRVKSDVNLNDFVPTDALIAGYELRALEFERAGDPWYLYDQNGRIVAKWLNCPSIAEVFATCQRLMSV